MAQHTPHAPPSGRLTAKAAALHVGVSRQTWYQWLATGELDDITHVDPAGRRYWLVDEVDAWLRSRCSEGEVTIAIRRAPIKAPA